MSKCDYVGCENESEYWDSMGNQICAECMEREINDSDVEPEDFESI